MYVMLSQFSTRPEGVLMSLNTSLGRHVAWYWRVKQIRWFHRSWESSRASRRRGDLRRRSYWARWQESRKASLTMCRLSSEAVGPQQVDMMLLYFSYLEPVCYSMSSSNCCFLTCIQISQEAGQVLWYSHLFQNLPQFIVIHTVIVNKAEIDVFLELSCFFNDPADVGNLISSSSAFSKTSLNIWKFRESRIFSPRMI